MGFRGKVRKGLRGVGESFKELIKGLELVCGARVSELGFWSFAIFGCLGSRGWGLTCLRFGGEIVRTLNPKPSTLNPEPWNRESRRFGVRHLWEPICYSPKTEDSLSRFRVNGFWSLGFWV